MWLAKIVLSIRYAWLRMREFRIKNQENSKFNGTIRDLEVRKTLINNSDVAF